MKKRNYFFLQTDTEERYTEEYLTKTIIGILNEERDQSFDAVFSRLQEVYPEVKINRAAVERLFSREFYVLGKQPKQAEKNKNNYFFGRQSTDERYTEEYLTEVVNDILSIKPLPIEEIYEAAVDFYGGVKINYSAFKRLLNEKFVCRQKRYWPRDTQGLKGKRVISASENEAQQTKHLFALQKYIPYSAEALFKEYHMALVSLDDVYDALLALMAIELRQGTQDRESCAKKITDIINNEDFYIKSIEEAVRQIDISNYELPISFIIKNAIVRRQFESFGILNVSDLIEEDPRVLLVLGSLDIEGAIQSIRTLSSDYYAKVKKSINEGASSILDSRTRDIMLKRRGFFTDSEVVLQAIGDQYEVSRQRILQIESKGEKKLKNNVQYVFDDMEFFFDFYLRDQEFSHMLVKEIIDESNDEETTLNACLFLEESESKYNYDATYHIVYDSSLVSIDDIENHYINEIGKLIAESKYKSLSKLERAIVDCKYTLSGTQENLYRLKRYKQNEFIEDIIRDQFPDGYGTYNEDDYAILCKEYKRRLGDDVDAPSSVAIRGIIDRGNFCLVDKGVYKYKEDCAEIPLELFDRISDYITEHLPVVEYVSIFESFKKDFFKFGIDNWYYVKGVLDYLLPDYLVTKRNYITESGNRISALEDRLAFMRSFKGAFTLDDLQNKYPGVKAYVFLFLCYDEEKNGLIAINSNKYIYYNNLNIADYHIHRIKDVIEELFASTNSRVLSSRKVFARIRLRYADLLEELPWMEDHHALFSIAKFLFSDDYYFDRPYISKDKPDKDRITTRDIILNHLKGQPAVDYESYRNFCLKMNINTAYTFMQLVEEMSDDYVQINDKQMIRKDVFGITDASLNDIDRILGIMFSKAEQINTATFRGYLMFPQIKYRWNKHILAGIVRSFFSDKYEVTNITQGLKVEAADYIIERCK